MRLISTILAVLFTSTSGDAWAQAHLPQTAQGITTMQSEAYKADRIPYSDQTDYNGIGNIPSYRSEPSIPSYMGVLGEKWETDKRGRRGTFIHNGQEMSVGYDTRTDAPNRSPMLLRPNLTSSPLDSLTRKIIAPSQTTLVHKRSN